MRYLHYVDGVTEHGKVANSPYAVIVIVTVTLRTL